MTANELADKLQELDSKLHLIELFKSATMLRQQQAEIEELETGLKNVWKVVEGKQTEIDRLNYDMEGFKQNFFVSGFHLQIKMANEQLLKQQEQIEALKAENSHLKYEISSGAWNPVPLTDAELSEVYEEVYINYAGKDFPVDLGRAILRKAQEK